MLADGKPIPPNMQREHWRRLRGRHPNGRDRSGWLFEFHGLAKACSDVSAGVRGYRMANNLPGEALVDRDGKTRGGGQIPCACPSLLVAFARGPSSEEALLVGVRRQFHRPFRYKRQLKRNDQAPSRLGQTGRNSSKRRSVLARLGDCTDAARASQFFRTKAPRHSL